ncbi:hypothetical protein BHE90_015918 [Fusarium euwallaceae]|uniref:Uncharacterized protein n=1 Tax=Fusarium euwallaceae TaxID=1147111 RepID=A0A430L1X6_9HYPO|nr:hypothetical protein BHE90_015918 [Fusarium euwallaceae]
MAPPSSENTKLVEAIKNVAAIAFEEKSGFSIEYTDDNDDENDNEAIPEKLVVTLQPSGSSELLRVETKNQIGGLLDLTAKICDEAIKREPRSSLSEKDIYGKYFYFLPSNEESITLSLISMCRSRIVANWPVFHTLPACRIFINHIRFCCCEQGREQH